MAYILDGTIIRSPYQIDESNSTLFAQQRTLVGSVKRDYFGSNKRVWVFTYQTTKKTDFDTINTIYLSYLSTGTAKTFQSSETNYTIASTNVHIDLVQRGFSIRGSDYISNFNLILTEA